jgi:pimeloyl-ACP methyl ester carboxylesterase
MATVQVHDQKLFFEDSGSGTPVVLGHSFLCTGDMWRYQVRALESRYRLINPDFRGHGRSGPAHKSYSLYDAVEDVVGVLDELGIDRAVWCGLSIGGMVALRAALTVPERVSALVIMDSDAGAETFYPKLKYRVMGAGARSFGTGPFLSPICRMMFGATTRRENPALVDEWRSVFAEMDIPSALQGLQALISRDSLIARIPEISVPCLVMVGQEDSSLPTPRSKLIHEGIENSEYVEIPGAGHLSALEQPEPVNEAMGLFLDRL